VAVRASSSVSFCGLVEDRLDDEIEGPDDFVIFGTHALRCEHLSFTGQIDAFLLGLVL
jgi:hypothetical protein